MTKKVKVVAGLTIIEVDNLYGDMVAIQSAEHPMVATGDMVIDAAEVSARSTAKVSHELVPLYRIVPGPNSEPFLVAYSPEVEEMLDLPIKALSNNIKAYVDKLEQAHSIINAITDREKQYRRTIAAVRNTDLWGRVKYLFTGKHDYVEMHHG